MGLLKHGVQVLLYSARYQVTDRLQVLIASHAKRQCHRRSVRAVELTLVLLLIGGLSEAL